MPFGLAATRRAVEAAAPRPAVPGRGRAAAGQGRPRFRHGRRALDTGRLARADRRSGNRWPSGCRHIPGVVEHGLFIGHGASRYSGWTCRRPRGRTAVSIRLQREYHHDVPPIMPGAVPPARAPLAIAMPALAAAQQRPARGPAAPQPPQAASARPRSLLAKELIDLKGAASAYRSAGQGRDRASQGTSTCRPIPTLQHGPQ